MERTPWTFDAILAVAGKIRSGNGPLSPTFYKCLEEAQGIARSSLFGPVVRKEAVQGMLLLAAWSTNGWLPSGHAMRMALDLGLHRALEKLADDTGKQRSEEEERNLVVSARIWLCLYWFDHQMSLGTGRPIVLRDENSIRHCRVLLNHPMASPTDVRLISQVELIAQKSMWLSGTASLILMVLSANLRNSWSSEWPGRTFYPCLYSTSQHCSRQMVRRIRCLTPPVRFDIRGFSPT